MFNALPLTVQAGKLESLPPAGDTYVHSHEITGRVQLFDAATGCFVGWLSAGGHGVSTPTAPFLQKIGFDFPVVFSVDSCAEGLNVSSSVCAPFGHSPPNDVYSLGPAAPGGPAIPSTAGELFQASGATLGASPDTTNVDRIPGGGIGLAPLDNVNALSFGIDFGEVLVFSVDPQATGAFGSAVFFHSTLSPTSIAKGGFGTLPSNGGGDPGNEAAGDIFVSPFIGFFPPPGVPNFNPLSLALASLPPAPSGSNLLAYDDFDLGLQAPAIKFSALFPACAGEDDLDALEADDAARVDQNHDGVPDSSGFVYMSLDLLSPTVSLGTPDPFPGVSTPGDPDGVTADDILVSPPPGGGSAFAIYARGVRDIGLLPGDDLDALVLLDNGGPDGRLTPGFDVALFSLAAGSPSLVPGANPNMLGAAFLSPGDVFFTNFSGPVALGGSGITRYATAAAIGLRLMDELNALDIGGPLPEPCYFTTPQKPESYIGFGFGNVPPLPADFFGPGSDPFTGHIELAGSSLSQRSADPISPHAPIGTERTVEIELIELNLFSQQPIRVTLSGGSVLQLWHLRVSLSPTSGAVGQLTAVKTHENGGTYNTSLPVQPRFTFSKILTECDVNCDGGIDGSDLNAAKCRRDGSPPESCCFDEGCACHADVDGDGVIDFQDISAIADCLGGDCTACFPLFFDGLNEVVLDTGADGSPPLGLGSIDTPWVHQVDPNLNVLTPSDGTFVPNVLEVVPGNPATQITTQMVETAPGLQYTAVHPAPPFPSFAACCLPDLFCIDLGTQFLITDGVGDPIPCDFSGCATGSCESCALADESVCDDVGGFWNAGDNRPPGSPDPILDCGFAGFGPCEIGSCCLGEGNCRDTSGDPNDCNPQTGEGCCDPQNPITCMTRSLCLSLGTGQFIGGTRCDNPNPPCPVCSADETLGNCQAGASSLMSSIDLNGTSLIGSTQMGTSLVGNGGGGPAADDFIAEVQEIRQFCFSPCFVQTDAGGNFIGECANPHGGVSPESIEIFVRFRVDGADDLNPNTPPGFPGDLVPSFSTGPDPVQIAARKWRGGTSRCWDYSIVFDPPITGFVFGQRYWVELSGTGTRDENLNGCELFLLGSTEGNGWAMQDGDTFGEEALGNRTWDMNDVHLWFESGISSDFAFCIEGGIQIPPPMTGACCQCDGLCFDDVAPTDCIRGFDVADGAIAGVNSTIGDYFPGQTCDEIECFDHGTCQQQQGQLGEVGEDCGNPMCIGPADALCANGESPKRILNLGQLTNIRRSNLCSCTDGPEQYADCGGSVQRTGNDQWFEVHTALSGELRFDVCGSGADVITAVYTNGTSTCPNDVKNGGACPPASDPVFCTDVACANQFDTPTGSVQGTDSCRGGPNDGLPCADDGECPSGVCAGQCFLIRVSGDSGNVGTFQLELDPGGCPTTQPPSIHRIPDPDGVPRDNLKGRYLAVIVNDVGRETGIQVEFINLPAPYDLWNGATMWARAPLNICETSTLTQVPPAPCTEDTYMISRLECTGTPFTTDWNALGVVNLWHEGIVPGGTYNVRVVDADCNPTLPASFSEPTEMETAAFGQTVGIGGFQFPVDVANQVSVDDALAGIAAFGNAINKPSKSRTELASACIDAKANIDDVLMSLSGFAGGAHPQKPSSGNACASSCPDP